jgi:hypothetical protein
MALRNLFFIVFSFSSVNIFSQSITITGKVIDSYLKRPVSGVSVILPSQNISYMTDGQGRFSLSCEKSDTLFLFFPGYRTTRFSTVDSIQKSSYDFYILFEPLTATTSRPVIVKPKKTLEDLEKERKELGTVPRELMKPEVSFMSPISALYDLLSARARERNKLRGQYLEDERRRIYKELFDYFNDKQLIFLPEDEYEAFIDYLGLPVEFLQQSSDYEITKTLLDNFKRFGTQRGFIK